MARRARPPRRQRGVAFLALAALLVMGFLWFAVTSLDTELNRITPGRNHNAEVLNQAKQALIGYLVKEAARIDSAGWWAESVPGRLPCPESKGSAGGSGEGLKEGACRPDDLYSARIIGRLPWRTLGIDKLADASGEALWYVADPDWVKGASMPTIGPTSTGQLRVDGVPGIVAIIIAPGNPLTTAPNVNQLGEGCSAQSQARDDKGHSATPATAPDLDYRNYVECHNATPYDNNFVTAVADNASNPVINDQIIYVTSAEVLKAINSMLTDRVQRTVAPLLSELSASWIRSGNIHPTPANTTPAGFRFLPYASPFSAPEAGIPLQSHCGVGGTREGLLPVAPVPVAPSTTCSTAFGSFVLSGSGTTLNCAPKATDPTRVVCAFSYYSLSPTAVAQLLSWGITPPNTLTVRVQASAPSGAASFRKTPAPADFTVTAPTTPNLTASYTLIPQTSGAAQLTIDVVVNKNNVCGVVPAFPNFHAVCEVYSGGLTTAHTVTLEFPAGLSNATVQGTQVAANLNPATIPKPMSFLTPSPGNEAATPAVPPDPHYWFFANGWYRYVYYAVAPGASAAQAGGDLTVNEFPDGTSNNKRFVLALMGPPMAWQTARSATASGDQYLEGQNASSGDDIFASRAVMTLVPSNVLVTGNDGVAACPSTTGGTCN